MIALGVVENRFFVIPEGEVNMRGTPQSLWIPLGQEACGVSMLPGDFLGGVLGDCVMICTRQSIAVADVEFLLTCLRFSLGVFYGNARSEEMVTQRTQDLLFLGGLQDVIVFVVAADWLKVLVVSLAQLIKALFEKEELQLCRHFGRQSVFLETFDLLLQHRSRRMWDVLVRVMIKNIAQNQRCPW